MTGGLFPETEMNEADEKVDEDGAAGACVMGWTRGSGVFCTEEHLVTHPPSRLSVFVTVISVELLLMLEISAFPLPVA